MGRVRVWWNGKSKFDRQGILAGWLLVFIFVGGMVLIAVVNGVGSVGGC